MTSGHLQEGGEADRRQRIVVAERNPLVISALEGLFARDGRYRLSAVARTANETYDALMLAGPVDLLLLGWMLADCDAPALIAGLQRRALAPRIVLFASDANPQIVRDAVRLGVHGLCYQFEDPALLFTTLEAVGHGRICIPYAPLDKIAERPLSRLTQRERELLAMLGDGWTNTQIASRTGISENTVKYHLKNLYDKLEVRNRAMAVALFAGGRNG